MQLTDTHCHIHEAAAKTGGDEFMHAIWHKAADPSPHNMINRAAQNGVTRLICVGTTVRDSQLAVDFVRGQPNCWASVGLHPHDAKEGQAALDALAGIVAAGTQPIEASDDGQHSKIVAIGECGLDYYYNYSPKTDQVKALRFQIELALRYNLPLIFHVRDALDDFWPIFDSYQNIRGVLHSFTDSQANLSKALARGLYIGANGIMTFSKSPQQLAMAKAIPLQKLLVETDSPFLTPEPLRGSINEPANAMLVAKFLAELRGESLADFANQTTRNASTLFNL